MFNNGRVVGYKYLNLCAYSVSPTNSVSPKIALLSESRMGYTIGNYQVTLPYTSETRRGWDNDRALTTVASCATRGKLRDLTGAVLFAGEKMLTL